MEAPLTRYASTPSGDVAYQTVGDGPADLLIVNPMSRCIDRMWDYDPFAQVLLRLARTCRLILFDRRGCGISDPLLADLPPTWEDWLQDMLAVLDDAGAADAVLLAERDSASAALLFAGSHPERTRALVLGNTSARFRAAPGYPCGESFARVDELASAWDKYWGTEHMVAQTRQALAGDRAYVRWVTRMQRAAYSPRRAGEEFRYIMNFDARPVLTAISAPCLVLHRAELAIVPAAMGQYLAGHLANARFELLPGSDLDVLVPGDDPALGLIERFLAATRAAPPSDKVLTTVLLAEVADEEQLIARLGSVHWNELRNRRHVILLEALARFDGSMASRDGSNLMVSFDGPARALRFAQALRRELRDQLQLDVRMGLHTGECMRARGQLDGLAVRVSSGVLRVAQAGEVLASAELRDLAAGSGVAFRSIGAHRLDGESAERELFALDD